MFNGVPLEVGDMIGAFAPGVEINSSCVGVFEIKTPGVYGSMPVYGDDPTTPEKDGAVEGDEITFKIWDVSADKIYEAIPKGPGSNIWHEGDFQNVNLDPFPFPPPYLRGTAGNMRVDLEWGEVPEAEGYNVYRSLNDSKYDLLADAGNQLTYTDMSVTNGTTYYYKVKAYRGSIESNFSKKFDVTPPFSFVETGQLAFFNGNVDIEGNPASAGDILAVFVDIPGKSPVCIGAYKFPSSSGVYDTIAYGDNPGTPQKDGAEEGDEITFKLWDASENVILDGQSDPDSVVWHENTTSQVDLHFGFEAPPIFKLNMSEGWNLISFPVGKCYYDANIPPLGPPDPAILPGGTELVDVTALGKSNLADWFTSVLTAKDGDWGPDNPPWRRVVGAFPGGAALVMDTEVPPEFHTLKFMAPGYAYWVNIKEGTSGVTLTLEGLRLAGDTPINFLKAGWNYVGYLPNVGFYDTDPPDEDCLYVTPQVWEEKPVPVTDYVLSSISGKYRIVQGACPGGAAIIYNPMIPPEFNTLRFFGVGNGYLIKLLEDATLIYPSDSALLAPRSIAIRRQTQAGTPAKLSDGVMPTNRSMFLYGTVSVAGQPAPAGSRITVWTENGLRIGAGGVTGDGVFRFLPIYGDDLTTPEVEGARVGETLLVTVNGAPANVEMPLRWLGQNTIQPVALTVHKRYIPSDSSVGQNYPNPFNPETWIPYALSEASPVTLKIYSVTGRLVRTLHLGVKPAGVYDTPGRSAYWDGRNDAGEKLSSGVYFYRFTANGFSQTKRMVLLK